MDDLEDQQMTALFASLSEKGPSPVTLQKILQKSRKTVARRRWFGIFSMGLTPLRLTSVGLAPVGVFVLMMTSGVVLWQQRGLEETGPSLSQPTLQFDRPPVSFGFQNVAQGRLPSLALTPLLDSDFPLGALTEEELKKRWDERHRLMLEADADALMMRGRRFKALGRVDLALNDFETIYRFYPDYTYIGDVLVYRAQCYAFQGNYTKAIESLEGYLSSFPSKKDLIQPMIDQLKAQSTTDE